MHRLSDDEIIEILRLPKTIAVVGISDKPDRDSYMVAWYLQNQVYRVIPVNPLLERVLNRPCYGSLREIPERVDIVDIFRRSEAVPEIVDEAIAIGAKVIWMQLGVVNEAAGKKAEQAGLKVVMNRCIMVDHGRLLGSAR
jgi:predicted CoA-binding protein